METNVESLLPAVWTRRPSLGARCARHRCSSPLPVEVQRELLEPPLHRTLTSGPERLYWPMATLVIDPSGEVDAMTQIEI
jgi:hypothetical protein